MKTLVTAIDTLLVSLTRFRSLLQRISRLQKPRVLIFVAACLSLVFTRQCILVLILGSLPPQSVYTLLNIKKWFELSVLLKSFLSYRTVWQLFGVSKSDSIYASSSDKSNIITRPLMCVVAVSIFILFLLLSLLYRAVPGPS